MSQYETLIYSVEHAVATITLNRPQMMNAFNSAMRRELLEVVTVANADEAVRVVVLAANGKGFCAGADLTERNPSDWSVVRQLEDEYKPILMAVHESEKLYISAVNGAAAGGGSAFALVTDLCVMAEDAFIYQAFAALSLVPDCGASLFLTHQLGAKRALELILSGERLSAESCVELGLANKVVPAESLMSEVKQYAAQFSNKAPLAVRYSKQLVKAIPQLDLSDAISMEAKLQDICINSEDCKEGARAFLKKRTPEFKGR